MKTTIRIIFLLSLLIFASCEKEEEMENGGYLKISISRSSGIDGYRLAYPQFHPVENMGVDFELTLELTKNTNTTKIYKSQKLLPGTYFLRFYVESPDGDWSGAKDNVIQIFAGETTTVNG